MTTRRNVESGPSRRKGLFLAMAASSAVGQGGHGRAVLEATWTPRMALRRAPRHTVTVGPGGPGHEEPRAAREPGQRPRARRGRGPGHGDPQDGRDQEEGPQADRADPVGRPGGAGVERDPRDEEGALDEERRRNGSPEAQADARRRARPERHVRRVGDEVQDPVAHDHAPDEERDASRHAAPADQGGGARVGTRRAFGRGESCRCRIVADVDTATRAADSQRRTRKSWLTTS